jgi:menaquinone-dependent protoporphyrinogen IX oxidase
MIDFGKYGLLTRAIINSVMRDKLKGVDLSKPFDFRDWGSIRTWAASLDMGVNKNGI